MLSLELVHRLLLPSDDRGQRAVTVQVVPGHAASGSHASVFTIAIAGLFWLDRDRDGSDVAGALAAGDLDVPRRVAHGLAVVQGIEPDDAVDYVEGSPFDRFVLSGCPAGGLAVLAAARNGSARCCAPTCCSSSSFCYCAVSVLVVRLPVRRVQALTKGIGNLTMVLLVLTDPPRRRDQAILRADRFLLIPLSVLLIKYYPALGRVLQPVDVGGIRHRRVDRQERARRAAAGLRARVVLALHRGAAGGDPSAAAARRSLMAAA